MAERNANSTGRPMIIRHRGRGAQIWIYLGKMLRMFVYQNDWKVLPMAALIAGLVGMVIRRRMFTDMEGTLMGAFALVMVCIWNGCFNSIQVICRERDVIKREHRSGMHVSSYIVSHMLYQALLCLAQTGVTLYITQAVGVQYPPNGLCTPWMIVDFGISMFLISYASDMMSLWVSCLAKSTTAAMTIMPFVLIFQLVFSGGMLSLPAWTKYVTPFTISNPGLKVLAAQSDYNSKPVNTIWNQVQKMKDREVPLTMTVGDAFELLGKKDNSLIAELRDVRIINQAAPGETGGMPDGAGIGAMVAQIAGIEGDLTLGDLVDALAAEPDVQSHFGDSYTFKHTVGELVDLVGEDRVIDALTRKVAEANQNDDYKYSRENVAAYWTKLLGFVFAFAALSVIALEFIDKDKR